jgi:hypothetical protein
MSTPKTLNPEEVYLEWNPDVAQHKHYGSRPYEHYLRWGKKEGRLWPSIEQCRQQYDDLILEQNAPSTSANDSQICEDNKSLATENTPQLISTSFLRPHRVYLEQNLDIDPNDPDFKGPLHHYLNVGKSEGRIWPRGKLLLIFFISFGIPIYDKLIEYRKLILEKYDLPYINIINGPLPDNYELQGNDFHYPEAGMIPQIAIQFLQTIRKINIKDYDYVLRVNCSTYVNIPLWLEAIKTFPKEKFVGGKIWAVKVFFFSGTAIIFSGDVLQYLCQDRFMESPLLTKFADDQLIEEIFIESYATNKQNIT